MSALATVMYKQLRRRVLGASAAPDAAPSAAPASAGAAGAAPPSTGAASANAASGTNAASVSANAGPANTAKTAHRTPGTFTGAALPICGVEVLIVLVRPWVLADIYQANLYVVAFYERFRRTVVLMAQAPDGAPYFYGPTDIVRVLRGLPLEMIPWRRLLYRTAPPPSWRLPIPPPRSGGGAGRTESVDSALLSGNAHSASLSSPSSSPTSGSDRNGNPGDRRSPIGSTDRTTAH